MTAAKNGAWIAALVLAGTAIRLIVAPYGGFSGDIVPYQAWAVGPDRMHIYDPTYQIPRCNYPPLYPIILKCLAFAHRALHLPGDLTEPVSEPQLPTTKANMVVIKLPGIAADACVIALLARLGLNLARPRAGLIASALYAFNPAIIYDSAVWGQTDTILAGLLIWAIASAVLRHEVRTGIAAALALLLKLQAAPVCGVLLVGVMAPSAGARRGRVIAGIALAVAAALALSILCGVTDTWAHGYQSAVGFYPVASVRAFNLWHLLGADVDDRLPFILGLSRRAIGLLLFSGALMSILFAWWRAAFSMNRAAVVCAAAALAFFALPTEIHERYSVPAVGLMVLAGIWDRRAFAIAVLLSLTVLLNLVNELPFLFQPFPAVQSAVNWIVWPSMRHVHVVISVIHLALLMLTIMICWVPIRPRTALR
jgi:Gpi18-like mannosyltransferase